jgi:hypothetical protein
LFDSAHTTATRQLYLDTSARLGLHILQPRMACLISFPLTSVLPVSSQRRGLSPAKPQHLAAKRTASRVIPVTLFNFRKFLFLTLASDSFHSYRPRGTRIVPSCSRGFFLVPPLLVSVSESSSTPILPQCPQSMTSSLYSISMLFCSAFSPPTSP